MSSLTRLLLDKSVVRRYFEGASGLVRGLALTDEEQQAILLVHLARGAGYRLFLSTEAYNLLLAHGRQVAPAEMLMFLKRVEVLYPTRYFKRWARRIRERTFSREDAKVLALATFGTDEAGSVLGVRGVVTFDRPMIRKWGQEHELFAQRLRKMTEHMAMPFVLAALPRVQLPEDV